MNVDVVSWLDRGRAVRAAHGRAIVGHERVEDLRTVGLPGVLCRKEIHRVEEAGDVALGRALTRRSELVDDRREQHDDVTVPIDIRRLPEGGHIDRVQIGVERVAERRNLTVRESAGGRVLRDVDEHVRPGVLESRGVQRVLSSIEVRQHVERRRRADNGPAIRLRRAREWSRRRAAAPRCGCRGRHGALTLPQHLFERPLRLARLGAGWRNRRHGLSRCADELSAR